MLRLVKPLLEHKNKYIDMINEWQQYGGPYVPCIIEYDCNNSINDLNFDATLKVVEDYSKGKIFDYDIDYFESSDFYFIFDDSDLIGMCEIRHNLKPLGKKTIGHIACGIRPLKEDGIEDAIVCHYSENEISPKIINKLGFKYQNSIISKVSNKEIKRYMKKL